MQFQLNVTLTEEDYIAFNYFHALQSKSGKKMIMKSRLFFIGCTIFLTAMLIAVVGWTAFSAIYTVLMGLFTVLYTLSYGKMVKHNIKSQVKKLKKIGKLPFAPETKLEFHEDKLVEITADTRIEQSYTALERICVVGNRFIYLYNSSVGAHILPTQQLKNQLNQEEFWTFLSQKCNTIEYY